MKQLASMYNVFHQTRPRCEAEPPQAPETENQSSLTMNAQMFDDAAKNTKKRKLILRSSIMCQVSMKPLIANASLVS